MQVEYLVRIRLPDKGWDVDMLEEAYWKTGREASRGLFLLAAEERDEEVVAATQGDRKGKVPRYLVTRFGVITFRREKVKGAGGYRCPLDGAIGLMPRQEATLWVNEEGV